MHIIVQAGGKGTRLEGLTKNKPKCLVPFENAPIIFHLFRKFAGAKFTIIADYKIEVLQKYLAIFGKEFDYEILRADGDGTASGIGKALEKISENEAFMVIWCDLILSNEFELPSEFLSEFSGVCGLKNTLKNGTQNAKNSAFQNANFSKISGKFIHKPSFENGVAGLFIFANKSCLKNIPQNGALVEWLQAQNVKFTPLPLQNSREIGTLLVYNETNPPTLTRPFNKIEFSRDKVVKTPLDEQGRAIAQKEVAWYRFVSEKGYAQIPQIHAYEPLTMRKIAGKNIHEYECLLKSQKKEILRAIIAALQSLHELAPRIPAQDSDSEQTYIKKTFERLDLIAPLVPFSEREFIKINARYYKNPLFEREKIAALARAHFAREFCVIHGDCTFSNMLFDSFNEKIVLIDPRGYFGETRFYGDADYDWAKLYYSLRGDYDQFNRKKFTLIIGENEVEMMIKSSGWGDMAECFFDLLPAANKGKIRLLHALIWLALSAYAWEDYDSICGAFYRGVVLLDEIL